MPYRSELKRPDLKGQFPCSVCGKVFCHSSSLSRHRMQAHFKSYTCTQCNQEISSNETLRSHMFRIHSISRMFMCRCCNWAFPDKTSLHIHMQSMLRNGTPGDVSVLARSSTEGPGMAGVVGEMSPHELDESPSSSPQEGRDSISPSVEGSPIKAPLLSNNLLNGSIFPALGNADALFTKLRSKTDSLLPQTGAETNGQSHWLAAWLANNPFANQLNLASIQAQLLSGGNAESLNLQAETTGNHSNSGMKMEMKEEDEVDSALEINTMEETVESMHDESVESHKVTTRSPEAKPSTNGSSLDSLLEKKGLSVVNCNRNKRKASKPQQLASYLKASAAFITADEEDEEYLGPARKLSAADGEEKTEEAQSTCPNAEQPSPTVSDSHTSGSSAPSGVDVPASPQKCFDCQVIKAKLGMSETRNRFLESKVTSHEAKIGRLDEQVSSLQSTVRQYERDQRDLRHHIETFEGKLLECQERAVAALGLLHKGPESLPAVKLLMENLLECTNLTFRNGKPC
uniref:C2H2-type domain-containing protein n=1 Tax=Parascaris univalens TaxID=6257 RepID=A0A915AVQ4_PARUN